MADWSTMADAEPEMNGEHLSDALLSAYINDEIEDAQAARAAGEHLARCDACRRELNDLQAVVSLLAELPEPVPARSFRLPPDIVPARPVRRDQGYIRLVQGMRWASALAAVLLLLVFGTDIVIHRASAPTVDTMTTASKTVPAGAERFSEGPIASGSVQPGAGSSGAASSDVAPAENAGSAAPAGGPAATGEAPRVSTLQAPVASPPPETDQARPATAEPAEPQAASRGMPSVWSLVEIGLALLIVWLLVGSLALPRLYPWLRGRRTG